MAENQNSKGNQSEERQSLRSQLFSSTNKRFASREVDLFGTTVEVRQPSVGQILRAQDAKDSKNALIRIMVDYCYVPGTGEKVFEKGDEEEIMSWPVGKWFTDVNNAISELTDISISDDEKN